MTIVHEFLTGCTRTAKPLKPAIWGDQIPSLRKLIHKGKMRLFKWSPAFAAKCGVKFRLRAVNRQFLEREIFDHLNQLTAKSPTRMKCLFLGMHYYTWHYPRLLKMDFYSLDMDPEQAVYGPWQARHRQRDGHGRLLRRRVVRHRGVQRRDRLGLERADRIRADDGAVPSGAQTRWAVDSRVQRYAGRKPYPVDIDHAGLFEPVVPSIRGSRTSNIR